MKTSEYQKLVINFIETHLDPLTKPKVEHMSYCKCHKCTTAYPGDFEVTRVATTSIKDELFIYENNSDMLMAEIVKQLKNHIKVYVFGPYHLHYRIRNMIWGIKIELFRTME